MTVRQDERLVDGPLVPVRCRRCAAEVLVRKSSWEQTSIQWTARARAACPELAADPYETCPALRSSIQEAALIGSIKVMDECDGDGHAGPSTCDA
ncbi:ferredoxin [Actinomadura sp. LD22]|uniref:Ferredoxin n=1 Tax=Actinomadura physcomitrii TaxID=2650748 RepID=A0A6I4MEN3_9ACTN|nr:ferredoxin [Actinomadura physcomitrii]MWA00676.1 ferredoxin [Actinomadura physcomitrii]